MTDAACVNPAPVFDIAPAAIGTVLVRLIAESANLGHKRPEHALHYGAEDMESENYEACRFIRDIFGGMTTRELAEKWYGGLVNASRFANEIVGAAITQQRTHE